MTMSPQSTAASHGRLDCVTDALTRLEEARIISRGIEMLMLNVGLRCNMSCEHCHQSASPARTESMTREVMTAAVAMASDLRPGLVEVTGGAPELYPHVRELIDMLTTSGHRRVRIRTNLTALLEPEAEGLVHFFADRAVTVLASLPAATPNDYLAARPPAPGADHSDAFARAIEALQRLADVGYGTDPRLTLELAINPAPTAQAPLPPATARGILRRDLTGGLGLPFDDALVITNVPAGRLREKLHAADSLDTYLESLALDFNECTLEHLACRTGLVVAWDGSLSDCDFNLGRGMHLAEGTNATVYDYDPDALAHRPIRLADHCLACTAAAGSG